MTPTNCTFSERRRASWTNTAALTSARTLVLLFTLACAQADIPPPSVAPSSLVSFPTPDGAVISALAYGNSDRAVILGSNGCMTKDGWDREARILAAAGFRVLAIDFRGQGQSSSGAHVPPDERYHVDVLTAVRYARQTGATDVSIIGASCAGDAAAQASVDSSPGEIDRLVLLAHGGIPEPERMKGKLLFVVTRDDANEAGPRLPRIREQYERAPQPKQLLILEGSAHAQRIFASPQGPELLQAILRFLARG